MIGEQVQRVSRSFGMVINQLNEPLRREVQVGYLLFRLGDNIEDTSSLCPDEKRALLGSLLDAFRTGRPFKQVLEDQKAHLWADLTEGERSLFLHTDGIIEAFTRLPREARSTLLAEAENMFGGMAEFQVDRGEDGYLVLPDTAALEQYCYFVAGTVGDFLTQRFMANLHDLDIDRHAQLLGARRSLALVLQVTNILRDVRDDHSHGHVFYPRSFFDRFDAARLMEPEYCPEVLKAGARMIRWLEPSIRLASAYILALPARSPDMRIFCVIPYVMALKTMVLVVGNPAIFSGPSLKISRSETYKTAALARLAAPMNPVLRMWFRKLWTEIEDRVNRVLATTRQ